MNIYERNAQKLLRILGANGSYLGFRYAAYGIRIALQDPDTLNYICKGLYVDIASHFKTDIRSVERNIRTIKNIIWHNASKEILEVIFYTSDTSNCPSNAFFIDALANYLLEQSEDECEG